MSNTASSRESSPERAVVPSGPCHICGTESLMSSSMHPHHTSDASTDNAKLRQVNADASCTETSTAAKHPSHTLIACCKCQSPVHTGCYGMNAPPTKLSVWYCDRCLVYSERRAHSKRCCLCPVNTGMLKVVIGPLPDEKRHGRSSETYAHVTCALFVPNVSFVSRRNLAEIGVITCQRDPSVQPCRVCMRSNRLQAKTGRRAVCHHPDCSAAFHVECLRTQNQSCLHFDFTQDHRYSEEPSAFFIYCPKHQTEYEANQKKKRASGRADGTSSVRGADDVSTSPVATGQTDQAADQGQRPQPAADPASAAPDPATQADGDPAGDCGSSTSSASGNKKRATSKARSKASSRNLSPASSPRPNSRGSTSPSKRVAGSDDCSIVKRPKQTPSKLGGSVSTAKQPNTKASARELAKWQQLHQEVDEAAKKSQRKLLMEKADKDGALVLDLWQQTVEAQRHRQQLQTHIQNAKSELSEVERLACITKEAAFHLRLDETEQNTDLSSRLLKTIAGIIADEEPALLDKLAGPVRALSDAIDKALDQQMSPSQ